MTNNITDATVSDAMIKAGRATARERGYLASPAFVRAVVKSALAAREDKASEADVERIWKAFQSHSVAETNETGPFKYYVHLMTDGDPFIQRQWLAEFDSRDEAIKEAARLNVLAAITAMQRGG